jgi:hypothetical protein
MEKRNLLTNFEYKSYDLIEVINNQPFKLKANNQSSFLEVKIDFAEGKLVLEADRQFILQHNLYARQQYLPAPKKRVQIQTDIFPSSVINLNGIPDDGLLLHLDGSIMNESNLNACTGMLVLTNEWNTRQDSNLWRLTFYIYDHSTDYNEIKFDLPLYLGKEFQMN